MTDKPKPPDDPAQSQRFIDMAREVEADEDSGVFDRWFNKIIRPGPVAKPKPPESTR
jgi:hypothetical protein